MTDRQKLAEQVARLQTRSAHQEDSFGADFKERVTAILAALTKKGWVPVVYHGDRTEQQQAKIVKSGASKTMQSFHVPGTALKRAANGFYTTIRGEAADIVDARYLWSGPAARLEFQFWKDLGTEAKAQALEWGGDWKSFPDVAHVELRTRETLQDTRGTVA